MLRVPLISNRAFHSKSHSLRNSMCLCYCKFAYNFLSDVWEQLATTASIYPNSF